VVELTLTLALLTGAGLMTRSFLKLYSVDLGIETDHLLTMRTQLVFAKYPKPEQRQLFFQTLEERVAALPGVVGAGVTTALPLDPWSDLPLEAEGLATGAAASRPRVQAIDVTTRYFAAMGIELVRGRGLTDADGMPGAETIVVNQHLASQLFGTGDPLGRRVRLMIGPDQNTPGPWMTIAGVAADMQEAAANRIADRRRDRHPHDRRSVGTDGGRAGSGA
jgi:hypothetical protein